jgi:hypothetical protein
MVLAPQVLDQLLEAWNGLQLMQMLLLLALAGSMTALYSELTARSLTKWELKHG